MRPEAQRIAIAEACEYKRLTQHKSVWSHKGSKIYTVGNLPNYLNSLDAMHEAERTLGKPSSTYANILEEVCRRDRGNLVSDGHKWHATAAQRAEAFLRTLNLWDDTK